MRRSVHFRAHLILLLLPLVAVPQPAGLAHQGDRFVREFSGAVPAGRRLRINAHGPVNVQAGAANNISYTVHLSVRARTEAEAGIVMRRYNVRVTPRGEWVEITAPGGPVISTVTVKAPRLEQGVVSTSDGAVDAGGIDGAMAAGSPAGARFASGQWAAGCAVRAARGRSRSARCAELPYWKPWAAASPPRMSAARCAPKPAAAVFTLLKPAARLPPETAAARSSSIPPTASSRSAIWRDR